MMRPSLFTKTLRGAIDVREGNFLSELNQCTVLTTGLFSHSYCTPISERICNRIASNGLILISNIAD